MKCEDSTGKCLCADGCPEGCCLRTDAEVEYVGANHTMTKDERLDDPRRGQAKGLNK